MQHKILEQDVDRRHVHQNVDFRLIWKLPRPQCASKRGPPAGQPAGPPAAGFTKVAEAAKRDDGALRPPASTFKPLGTPSDHLLGMHEVVLRDSILLE